MKKTKLAALLVSILLGASALFAGCSAPAANSLTATVQHSMVVGEKTQINVDKEGATFSSSNSAIITVSGTGLVTAVAEGEANVTVTAGETSTKVYFSVHGCGHVYLEGACIFCSEADPDYEEPTPEPEPIIYDGLTASQLDAIPNIGYDEFGQYMNVTWNFGWEGDATLESNAKKADFDGTATADSKIWRFTGKGEHQPMNAGWGVGLWAKGAESQSVMYSKVSVPATCTQFRIWAVGNKNEHWSGQGNLKAVALYKNASGQYEKRVLLPIADTFIGLEEGVTRLTNLMPDGSIQFTNATNFTIPHVLDNCMLIYDMSALKGMEDVIIMVENNGIGNVLGTEETEVAEGVPAGQVMPEVIIVKRVMFL